MNNGLIKIREDINNIFILKDREINDNVIDYLRKIFFVMSDIMVIDSDAPCFRNEQFMLFILNQNIDNIKYYNAINPNDKILELLIRNNYVYRTGDNPCLLQNRTIIDNVIEMGDINNLLINDVSLTQKQLDNMIDKIKNRNINIKYIYNKYLINNSEFLKDLMNLFNVKNPYDLPYYLALSNIARSLELGLDDIVGEEGTKIIINDLIRNNYYINILSILNNISLDKLKELYTKLIKLNNVEFNLELFINIMEYLSHNLELVKDINNVIINDVLINNLNKVIKTNNYLNYLELISL